MSKTRFSLCPQPRLYLLNTLFKKVLKHLNEARAREGDKLAQALMERVVYDPDSGQLLTGSFMDYAMPRAGDMPHIEIENNSVPTNTNPMGAKGAGEAGTVGALPVIVNAVLDALRPLGVTHIEMPATPNRVWDAITAAASATPNILMVPSDT